MFEILSETPNPILEKTANAAFSVLGLEGRAAVELICTDEEEIRKVNKSERGVDSATDVLSFPMLDAIKPFTKENYPFDYDTETDSVFIGSILICESVARRQAQEYGHGFEREYAYLFLHGLLHLLGYDHIADEDKKAMREREEQILSLVEITR
ncbi:MAG: rRNA maturation RNase YbeY [Clostridia bacterium]|nr:rRNA maturation RNase YbeY [Clostridia bacterium]